ncbi:MAG: metal-sulfur cluster assembly factor [Leptospira sp.]|nr:metal-sulfur cluster assembly factor [Leptospira sp.]
MEEFRNEIEKALYDEIHKVEDPELFISIAELGLIYDIKSENGKADVKMTFTSMACPAGPQLKQEVYNACLRTDGVTEANVEVVWNPKWDPKLMASEDAKMELGIYD